MATGDPTGVEVLADGWRVRVRFEGLAALVGTAAVADFVAGFDSDEVPTTDAANFYLTVTSEGYDATGTLGTIERIVYVTRAMRQEYPNQASLEASSDSGDMLVDFALSAYVHDDDTATSTIKSGLHASTNAGTPTVTNNSTVDYPPVTRFKFATEPGQRLSGTFEPAVSVGHAYAQQGRAVAAVEFTLTDSSANSVSQVVTASEADQSVRDPDLPLRVEVFRASLDTSSLDDDEAATLRVRVFPWVGDADTILDTNGGTFPDERANQPHHIGGTVYYAYAQVGAGGGTVSTTAATAQADPYPSIWDARNALNSAAGSLNNCVIRCIGGSHAWGRDSFAGVAAANSAFVIIETDPDEASNATITTTEATSNEIRCARVWLRDINITPAGSVSNFFASVGSSDLYQLSRCVVTHSGSGTVFKASAVEYFRAYDCLLVNMIASFTTDAYMTEWQNCEHSVNINAANIHGGWFDEASNFGGSSVFSTSSAATFCLTNIRMQNDAAAIISLGHAITNSYIGHSV
ncbi:MAG: hypothetical protein ACIAQU_04425, partial [Phycisphaerales bacterium JB064]